MSQTLLTGMANDGLQLQRTLRTAQLLQRTANTKNETNSTKDACLRYLDDLFRSYLVPGDCMSRWTGRDSIDSGQLQLVHAFRARQHAPK